MLSVHVDCVYVFAAVVERQIVAEGVVRSAAKAAATEREPTSSGTRSTKSSQQQCRLASSPAVNETAHISNEVQKHCKRRRDIGSSLHSLTNFCSMLDTVGWRPRLEVKLAPTDLLKDVLEPVCSMSPA
jgi:hypothetical protein